MAFSYGGMQPTFRYDPQQDPKIVQREQLRNIIAEFAKWAVAEKSEERRVNVAAMQTDAIRQTKKGLTIDTQLFLTDNEYRESMLRKEKDFDRIVETASAFSPAAGQGFLAEKLQGIINVFPDVASPEYITSTDINELFRVLITGDEDLNEPALIDLSAEEIAGIDGVKSELEDLGIWGENEDWEDVRPVAKERLTWFANAFKGAYGTKNQHYVASESDVQTLINKRLLNAGAAIDLVRSHKVVKDAENADDNWIRAQARLFPTQKGSDYEGKIQDLDGEWIDTEDYWGKYEVTSLFATRDIADLYNDMVQGKLKEREGGVDTFARMMKALAVERPDVWSRMSSLIDVYGRGSAMLAKVEGDADAFQYIDLQVAAANNLRDMESAQEDLIPLAQEYVNLDLQLKGVIPMTEGFNEQIVSNRIKGIGELFTRYEAYRIEQYESGQFSLRPDEIDDIFNKAIERHAQILAGGEFDDPSEDRKDYINTLEDLNYTNILDSLNKLVGVGR